MQQRQTPVAGKKNTAAGSKSTTNVYIGTQPDNKPDPSDGRHNDSQVEPQQNTGPDPKADGIKDIPRPIFQEPRLVEYNGNGKGHYASPLAASIFARFDPRERRIQPAEFWQFHDRDFAKRKRI